MLESAILVIYYILDTVINNLPMCQGKWYLGKCFASHNPTPTLIPPKMSRP